MQRQSTVRSWLAIVLVLLIASGLCLFTAFALNLQVTSPYFTLAFGPPRPTAGLAANSQTTSMQASAPSQSAGNSGSPVSSNQAGCLLGLLCLGVGGNTGVAALSLNLGKEGSDGGCLLGLLCLGEAGGLDLDVDAESLDDPALDLQIDGLQSGSGDCGQLLCLDAEVGDEGSSLEANSNLLGTNTDPQDGLQLNLLGIQVGLGGAAGVQIGLPSLFP